MSTEDIKTLARRIPLEAFSQGNAAVFDEVVAEDANEHLPPPGLPPGREGYKQFVTMLHAAFSASLLLASKSPGTRCIFCALPMARP